MAMDGLTRALAAEPAATRVNLVVPGFVTTPLSVCMADDNQEAKYQKGTSSLPVGHVGEPGEVAKAYRYFHAPEL